MLVCISFEFVCLLALAFFVFFFFFCKFTVKVKNFDFIIVKYISHWLSFLLLSSHLATDFCYSNNMLHQMMCVYVYNNNMSLVMAFSKCKISLNWEFSAHTCEIPNNTLYCDCWPFVHNIRTRYTITLTHICINIW